MKRILRMHIFLTGFGENEIKSQNNYSFFISVVEHGPVDDETVVPRAAADDQTEHKQCKFLFSGAFCQLPFSKEHV